MQQGETFIRLSSPCGMVKPKACSFSGLLWDGANGADKMAFIENAGTLCCLPISGLAS